MDLSRVAVERLAKAWLAEAPTRTTRWPLSAVVDLFYPTPEHPLGTMYAA